MALTRDRQAALLRGLRYFLHRNHAPLVEVRSSNIPGAGLGVFVKRPIEKGQVVCLYPGIYTPGLPKSAATESEGSTFLADMLSPSGGETDENAYILNLSMDGGYIDGAALIGTDRRRFDENPSACGHLVNHSSKDSNVEMVSFPWNEVTDRIDYNEKHLMTCPNELRADGTPWYSDGITGKVVRFPTDVETRSTLEPVLYGAAFCSAEQDLDTETEVLLDYKLKGPPFPPWAAGWYA